MAHPSSNSDEMEVGGKQVDTSVVRLAKTLTYDFGDTFYEPVAQITEEGFSTYGMEAWARKHEVKRIEMDARTFVKTAHYYGELGEIDTQTWPQDKHKATAKAKKMAAELVEKEIAAARHKSDKALQEMNKLQAIRADTTVTDLELKDD